MDFWFCVVGELGNVKGISGNWGRWHHNLKNNILASEFDITFFAVIVKIGLWQRVWIKSFSNSTWDYFKKYSQTKNSVLVARGLTLMILNVLFFSRQNLACPSLKELTEDKPTVRYISVLDEQTTTYNCSNLHLFEL